MKIADLVRALDVIAPLSGAEEWDNVGLLTGDPEATLSRALLAIDCTRPVLDEATRLGCQAIVAYHPPIFRPLTRVLGGSLAWELARRNLAVHSPHTALDAASGGTNDVLADAVGIDPATRVAIRPLAPKDGAYKLVTFVPADALARVSDALFAAGAGRVGEYRSCSFRGAGTGTFFGEEGTSPAVGRAGALETVDEVRLETRVPIARAAEAVRALRASHPYEEPAFDLVRLAEPGPASEARGMGRIGEVPPIDRRALVARVKERLALDRLLVAGPTEGGLTRVAVCAGSAGDLLDAAIRQGAQAIVTGEVRHHDALDAAARGVLVVCALHSNSERIALPPLGARLRAALPGVEIAISATDRDPFAIL